MDDPSITNNFGLPTDIGQELASSTSGSWKLESCQLKCDICTLDNALDNNYVAHLLSGKTLHIVYNAFISNIQTVLSEDTQINVSRSLTKLRSVFFSLDRDLTGERARWYAKGWNSFYSPMAEGSHTVMTRHVEEN
jgi:hypothetical protein